MSIYQKNLRRLGLLLIAVSILDVILELVFYTYLQSSPLRLNRLMQSQIGICVKDGIGLAAGALACFLYYHKEHARWIVPIEAALLVLTFPVILLSTQGNLANRVDSLINAMVILLAMAVYTALQLEKSERNWQRISHEKAAVLDLKLTDIRQWFNPIEIGPKLELSGEISAVVDRFLHAAREPRPLEVTVLCPGEASEAMQATMREVFQMYYEDEERHVNSLLERRYLRVMALVIVSIVAASVWINYAPSAHEGVTWTILSNFAAFSLWQIGNTHFERSDGYAHLLQVLIAKQATIQFWAE